MDLNGIPLFALMRDRMSYLDRRQQVIASNVANADTPGYVARDLQPFAQAMARQRSGFSTPREVGVVRTNALHLAGEGRAASPYEDIRSPDSETTLDGNRVVLEDEMVRMAESRMNYDAAVGFYQKSLGLLRMAARSPGRGG